MSEAQHAVLARRTALGALQPLRPAGSYTFDELYRLGQVMYASGLFDDVKDAAQATVKILKGQEMGLPPTTAMSAFDLIQKKLFIKPWAIAAKINTCGYGLYKILRQDADVCTLVFSKKYPGTGWVECPPVSYTFEEAKAHGLTTRSAHWKANPAHMLYQRAMGRGGAMYFPELLAGLEAPQDDTPISVEQGQAHILDLYGDTDAVTQARETATHGPEPWPVTSVSPPEKITMSTEACSGESAPPDLRATPLGQQIDAGLATLGASLPEMAAWWAKMGIKYAGLSPGTLSLLSDQIQAKIAARQATEPTEDPEAQETSSGGAGDIPVVPDDDPEIPF